MVRFLGDDPDALHEAVAALAAAVTATSGSGTQPSAAWSGVRPDDLAAAVEVLDPLPAAGVPFDQVVGEVRDTVLRHQVRPWHRRTVAHLHSPTLLEAGAAELAIGATNQSMDSYDQAPAATLVEDRLVRRVAEVVGLPASASGVMTAGGTASNIFGLVLAREAAARRVGHDVGADGLPAEAARWRILTSAEAHFSVDRAASLMGLGRRAVVRVACDESGSMDPAALDAELEAIEREGLVPIAIVGTAGTTDLGAIDPLRALAERAAAANAWFHVDAAVSGAFALSDRLAPRLDGIGAAHSVTVDLHKLWWQPISASMLLVADEASFSLVRQSSDYLDRADDEDTGVLNLVGRSLDTSRRFDALKALVSLRTVGRAELAVMLEHLVDLTSRAADAVRDRPRLELLAEPQSVMLLFRVAAEDPVHADRLNVDRSNVDRLNVDVQRRLFDRGDAVIGRTRHRGQVALKLTLVNPRLTDDDVAALLDLVVAEAESISR